MPDIGSRNDAPARDGSERAADRHEGDRRDRGRPRQHLAERERRADVDVEAREPADDARERETGPREPAHLAEAE